jgi:sec-independent protein translocase protein TatA
MPNIGVPEIAIVLVIVLIVFGPKRLPELGKSLGSGIRGFRGAMSGDHDDDDSVEKKQAELQAANQQPAAQPADQGEVPAAQAAEKGEVVTENKG